MKIYLAARYREKNRMQQFRKELLSLGHEVTSTWMLEEFKPQIVLNEHKDVDWGEYAERDLEEIEACDLLIAFSVSETTPIYRGGSTFETGYALGLDKYVLIVGPLQNIFYYTIPRVANWRGAKEWLEKNSTAKN